jgi:ornithine cyclodeaminase/alanine dehydrogenase-like protein (mu-crystallin family)
VPIYLKEADVAELFDMPSAIDAVREAFLARASGDAVIVPRRRWEFGDRRLNVMGGGIRAPKNRYAIKSYGSSAYHVLLYSPEEGLIAILEANTLGQIRTGAATAVASERMARTNARKVGMIGGGWQAHSQAKALHAIGKLAELDVFVRTRSDLETFCAELAVELGVPVRAAASAEAAVADADIVVAITNSATPVVMHDWLKAGAHVNACGANAATRRELDPEIVLRAATVVTDDIEQAKLEAGELIDLVKAGKLDWSRVKALHQIVAAPSFAREAGALTVFKSLGVGLEDVAAASLIYDRAMASGRFKPL